MNNDNMDKLKHEHGITDEHGYHKDQHQVHHAGHDHCMPTIITEALRNFS